MPRDPRFRFARETDVERLIDALGNPAKETYRKRLDAAGVIHFVSLHVVRARRADERSFLVLEATTDGAKSDAINALCDALGEELLVIFRRARGVDNLDELRRCLHWRGRPLSQGFLRLWANIGLPFDGMEGLSVQRILEEERVVQRARRAVDAFSQKQPHASALMYLRNAAEEVAKQLPGRWASHAPKDETLKFVDSDDAPWLQPRTEPTILDYARLSPALAIAGMGVILAVWFFIFGYYLIPGAQLTIGYVFSLFVGVAIAFSLSIPLGLALVALIAWPAYRSLRRSEQRNKPNDLDPDPNTIREIMKRENHPGSAQNHMISVCEIIPEGFRRNFTLLIAMRAIREALQRRLFRGGFLADIGTIHFARWVVLPGANKLVFFSNYDGSWESYLEDFITKASAGLTGVWSNCVGFPRTKHLFMEGAKDGDRFKRWARRSMLPTRFWYSAYPGLTTQQIRTNALICDGMRKVTTATDAEAWLELFDSIPRPVSNLEQDEIQKLIISGLKNLSEGRCLAIAFADGGRPGEWIEALLAENRVTFAAQGAGKATQAAFIALSASGMRKLGVEQCRLDRTDAKGRSRTAFPTPFVVGMHDETRKNVLSDFGENEARHWIWGSGEKEVDAVRLLYGTKDTIDDLVQRELNSLQKYGLAHVHTIEMQSYGPNKDGKDTPEARRPDHEPFGYVDGLSQPITLRSSKPDALHDVEAGEFILGYRDSRGYFPPSLLLPKYHDKEDILPGPPSRLPKRWPQFRRGEGEEQATRDLGRNGSFLVIRQLEQDVDAFNGWLRHVAAALLRVDPKQHEKLVEEHVGLAAAKVMGRWRDGVSIIQAPHRNKDSTCLPDNDFLYGRDDPQGHLCPFGAHIRRANPRDSLNPGDKDEVPIANRHRLLRRGRPYKDGGKQGMLFMCFNADIERQFEFVQQNWINASSHHGLRNEHDPVASHHGECSFTMPSRNGPPRVVGRPKPFVAVRGGGYFFMPSCSALKYLARERTRRVDLSAAVADD